MKELSNRLLITALFLFYITNIILGQGKTDFNVIRSITLNGVSEIQKIILPITEQYNDLNLNIMSNLNEGDLTIEIYDPVGENQGNFSIGCQLNLPKLKKNKPELENKLDTLIIGTPLNGSSYGYNGYIYNNESVQGKISRSFKNPIKGNWIVKIIPKNAKGFIRIETSQLSIENTKQ